MALGKNLKTGKKKEEPEKSTSKAESEPSGMKEKKDPVAKTEPEKEVPEAKKEVSKETESPKKADVTRSSVADLNKELESERSLEEHTRMLVVFAVGDEEYAFDIDQIKEVVPVPSISRVPQTKNYIRGVANVRGNVLAVIDLAIKFALQKTDAEEDYVKYVIVIKSEDIKVAVASGQVPETLMVSDSQMDSTADVVRKSQNEQGFIKGVIKKDKRMIICIDILEMLENEQHVNI